MFTVTRVGPNRIDITYSGKLDSDEMSAALDDLVSNTEDIDNGRMLFRVGEFVLPTLGAIKIELSRWPSMFGFIRQFRRCAVVAEQRWLKTIAEVEGALIPGVTIKGFGLDEEAAAEAWLAED